MQSCILYPAHTLQANPRPSLYCRAKQPHCERFSAFNLATYVQYVRTHSKMVFVLHHTQHNWTVALVMGHKICIATECALTLGPSVSIKEAFEGDQRRISRSPWHLKCMHVNHIVEARTTYHIIRRILEMGANILNNSHSTDQ